ncbi:peptide ABC transporter permease [Thioclava sp. SK-1]|uniref:ABC transporter permease n=1 Tax=Thioclava sp. SK-1 TaxID=1889770 RepID=UPI000824A7DE|nr:ABC transporter permease [Thioclava sp. SK-1]OCX58114.1 peptide ABC transporter permease [Thioclava sp. SK-1]
MLAFFVRRFLSLLPTLALVLVIVFSLVRLIPGDPAVTLLGPGATDNQIAALRLQLNLDAPAVMQFWHYVIGLVHGDLGVSLKSGQPVLNEIMLRLPATLEIAVAAVLAAIVIGTPIGVLSATRPNSGFDHSIRILSLTGVSMPAFLLALVLQLIFATWLGWLPVSGRMSSYVFVDHVTGFAVIDAWLSGEPGAVRSALLHMVLPVTVLAAFLAATLGRFVRATMLETLAEDYVRTARAKGLTRREVVYRHALRTSLLPAITVVGLKFAEMLGGAILTETIFSWPGIGRFMFEAIRNRDYPVIQGATLVFALLFMLTSLMVDLMYALLDPRVRRKMN